MNEFPILYSKKEECCGCGACAAICNHHAINMQEDEEGFFYPNLIESRCIKCYQCIRVCPFSAN